MTSPQSFKLDPKIFNEKLYLDMLNFWFKDVPRREATIPMEVIARWMGHGRSKEEREAFDKECHSEVGHALESISPEHFKLPEFKSIEADKDGNYAEIAKPFVGEFTKNDGKDHDTALALILFLDQMPRNIYRQNQKNIFNHYDRISRSLLVEMRKHNLDIHEDFLVYPPWRMWFYMPLVHSESLKDHADIKQVSEGFIAKMEEAKQDPDLVKRGMDSQEEHADILRKFGRYPHRNKPLGRQSTKEEEEYLASGGQTFAPKDSS